MGGCYNTINMTDEKHENEEQEVQPIIDPHTDREPERDK